MLGCKGSKDHDDAGAEPDRLRGCAMNELHISCRGRLKGLQRLSAYVKDVIVNFSDVKRDFSYGGTYPLWDSPGCYRRHLRFTGPLPNLRALLRVLITYGEEEGLTFFETNCGKVYQCRWDCRKWPSGQYDWAA